MMENYELKLFVEHSMVFLWVHSGTHCDITKSYIPTGAYHQVATVPFIYAQSHIPSETHKRQSQNMAVFQRTILHFDKLI